MASDVRRPASQSGTVRAWASETWLLSKRNVYGALGSRHSCARSAKCVRIDNSYIRQSQPAIQLQIQRAGVRLAAVLNAALRSEERSWRVTK